MNDIMPFLNLTSECSHDFIDCSIFIENKTFMHIFFEKPTRSEKSLDAKSALPESAMQSSLRQEVIRIAIHPDVQFSELKEILDRFAVKLYNSSHSPNRIKLIFVDELLKFKEMKQLDQLDPICKPLYLNNNHNKDKRKIVNKHNWFISGN